MVETPAADDVREDDGHRKSVFIGAPPMCPSFRMDFNECAEQLNWWDRVVLLGGGYVFGFCLGVSCAILAFATHERPLILLSLLVALLSATCCVVMYFKTRSMANGYLRQLTDDE